MWSTLGFVLNGLVFMLIGLELPEIINQLGPVSLADAIKYGVLISLVVILTRVLSTLFASVFTTFISRFITTADSHPGWRGPLIFGWAGMRGVVSLAAALSIPLQLKDGSPFPQRNLILFITFMVILITLVLQGLTLPLVIKWVNMEDPDKPLPPEEQELRLRKKLADYSLKYLDEEHYKALKTNKALQQLKARYENDQSHTDHILDDEQDEYRRVYLLLLEQQRRLLHKMNKKSETSEELIRKHQGLLDLEEEKLRMRFE